MALLIVIQKSENFLNKRNVKTTKQVLKILHVPIMWKI